MGPGVFALLRSDERGAGQVLCLHNLTVQAQAIDCSLWRLARSGVTAVDLISSRSFAVGPGREVSTRTTWVFLA